MADFRNVSGRNWWFIALLAMALPAPCYGENAANFFHFGPGELLIIGAVVALPTAVLCVLAEVIFPRRRLPLWLTGLSAATAAISIALVVVAMKAAAQQRADSQVLVLFIVPPMVVLALRGMVNVIPQRLATGWFIAVASVGLAAGRQPDGEAGWLLAGGAAGCMLLWTFTVLILQARRLFPPEMPGAGENVKSLAAFSAASGRMAVVGEAVSRALPLGKPGTWSEKCLARLRPAQAGLTWWFASACFLYFGIGVAIQAGRLGGGGWLDVEWQYVADLFGLRYPSGFRPVHAWWVFGLPWSLFAGSAFWGLAALLGGFDPGRARVLRFAAVVFGGALLVWTASIVIRMADVNEREERASGIHR